MEQLANFRGAPVTRQEEQELARIALASLEAEAVAWDYERASCITSEGPQGFKRVIEHEYPPEWAIEEGRARKIVPLFTAPPAPVSVPDEVLVRLEHEANHVTAWHHMDEHSCKVNRRDLLTLVNACRAAMLQGAEPESNHDELPLDYLQGQKDGLEWAAQLAEANHPQTGDWLYDDPVDLAKAIRKGPDMPEGDGNSPVIPDGWVLVPVEPTEAMNKAGWAAMNEHDAINPTYRAMLAAAPTHACANDVWVACSERMPEGMTDVNISNGHDVGQGWWDGDTWQTQHDYYSVPGDVTHWMPIPKPPLK
ncbi:DUF551 domain-containing protein [Enterobacter soli]